MHPKKPKFAANRTRKNQNSLKSLKAILDYYNKCMENSVKRWNVVTGHSEGHKYNLEDDKKDFIKRRENLVFLQYRLNLISWYTLFRL